MAFLDDELAAEEVRELELHLTECAACRAHVEAQRAEATALARALAAPPTPDLLRARIGRALDAEDAAAARAERKKWSRWMLPGSAIAAAAAAMAVFVVAGGPREPGDSVGPVAHEAVRQQTRALPLEVQGASTNAWLQQNFEPSVAVPHFDQPGSQLVGARLLPRGVNGHDAALLSYQVNLNGSITGSAFVLSVLIVRDVRDDEMQDGTEVQSNGRTLRVVESEGHVMVTTVDNQHRGYMFMAPELSGSELVWLVGRTTLVP